MNKKINSYEDLLAEKRNLEALFEVQKSLFKMTVDEIKSDLDPAFNSIEFLRKQAVRHAAADAIGIEYPQLEKHFVILIIHYFNRGLIYLLIF